MAPKLFSFICIAVCIAALYFAYKIYKDTQKIKKKIEDDDEAGMRF